MTNNPTIDGLLLETLKKWRRDFDACQRVIWLAGGFDPAYCTDAQACIAEMDAFLDERAAHPSSGPAGPRERFEKWVMAKKHPVLGFLDGHWLKRGDDREGYANEYVQGLWVAFKEFDLPPLIKTLRENGDLIAAEATIAQLQQRVAQLESGQSEKIHPELGSAPSAHMTWLLEKVVNPRDYPEKVLHEQIRSTLEVLNKKPSATPEPLGWVSQYELNRIRNKQAHWATLWATDGSENPSRMDPTFALYAYPQEPAAVAWRDMATAPKDGTLLILLVEFDEHSTEDEKQAPTIGANNFTNDGQDEWVFAGWCWSHDHWTQGVGKPIGWRPLTAEVPEPKQLLARAFTTLESGDGRYKIVACFQNRDDAYEAYRLICGGKQHIPPVSSGHCRNGDACVCGGDTAGVRATCGNWVKP
jgi:hypothetical protein